MSAQAYKILVVGPSWVGDMVMAQSLFIALKQQHPACLIDVLAPAWSLPLLERMPEVRRGIAMPLGHGQFDLPGRFKIGKQLKAQHYDQAIVLPNSWKSALIPFFAGIPKRTGYLGELRWGLLNDARRLDKSRLTMTVQRFVALGLPSDTKQPPLYQFPKLSINAEQQQQVREKFHINSDSKILALCPGAEYGPAKRWPAEHYAAVARQKQQQGWQVWLFGSDKDKAVADQINQLSGGICRNFAGATTLAEAVDLLSLSAAVVSNDSGLMHVAAALDKKLIAVYGSSDPGFTPPLHQAAEIISLNLACSPCFKRDCPLGHTHCLTDIAPERVLAALAASNT
ncbi:lipopolysaccharide heptosyltransferase II [Methylomonas montana]|uniref:lipopolysaccharide heptosyltransferase II n=1 Tax=Methylomonas montana TaxID=3058963 RepID=UPI00265ADE4D|nr:lipopolysaccharide heptosyltransferase II [Methylomonas montana]WKJ91718.1 lipopolysaccharide heptosyltransferase II [Methylomonas montana]